ncbi:MAG TPA: sodium/calcium exchanger protein [Sandaracinaceae bacterium LLY-WYZ-13_1]|nr:sodium/calcium exchanger protein [Sandaracinaceae bacterium LLY-WYZ-13_1]
MAGGGGAGNTWIYVLVAGTVLCGAGYGLEIAHAGPHWLAVGCLALGGLGVVFGSCEAMIKCVEGVGERLSWNQFVAGTLAGLASNIPEIVMLGFVVAAAPRVAFVVVTLTLHVNALMFGVYSGLLPRDVKGQARLPEPLVKISTDLYAAGGGVFLATGLLMVLMTLFDTGDHRGEGFGVWDLYAIGLCLLFVQVVATTRLVKRFSAAEAEDAGAPDDPGDPSGPDDGEAAARKEATGAPAGAPGWGKIAWFGLLGIGTSVLGGHAVGDFADALVEGLNAAGYPEMVGAIILSLFAGAGAYVMIVTAHVKRMHDIALANVSGSITQVPFLVLPAVLLLIAALNQLGVVPTLEYGSVLAIDLETTSVVLLAFPPMLILWKSVQDDGKVNWVETAGMVAVFGLNIYFLAQHG